MALHHRQVPGVGAPQDAIDVYGALAIVLGQLGAVGHEPADDDRHPLLIDRRQSVLGGELRDAVAEPDQQEVPLHQERVAVRKVAESAVELAGGADVGALDLGADPRRLFLGVAPLRGKARVAGIADETEAAGRMAHDLAQQVQPLAPEQFGALQEAGQVPAGACDALDETGGDGIPRHLHEHDRNVARRVLQRLCLGAAGGADDVRALRDELRRKPGQARRVAGGVTLVPTRASPRSSSPGHAEIL